MGVHGLWTLISPVARPINLETMGNKKLAIDSSIWLYQFQKAMRDREGRGIVNAHILGFLRRISKLLYYGIKPVFVFDGGVPTLKKQTINERKQRKRGGQENLAKTAEKLLAAQLRQVAVKLAQKQTKPIDQSTGDLITDNTVYFDDSIAQDFLEKNVAKKKARLDTTDTTLTPVPSPEKPTRFVPKDQFQLPPIDHIPLFTEKETDHRLATELELKQFIHEFTPEDLDINSPDFQSLSTELKYEIIGDLRVKSRQPNKTRVEAMRKTRDHEFSQTQILNLKKRNDLTQKLLTVTDMVAKANLTIPVKIAAQRNKEYVLVKASEGWILGIESEKQSGTQKNPLKIDVESQNENLAGEIDELRPLPEETKSDNLSDSDEDLELEEVIIPTHSTKLTREKQRDADLADAIRFHYGTKDQEPLVEIEEGKPKDDAELFQPDEDDEMMRDVISEVVAHEALNQSNKDQPVSSNNFPQDSNKTNIMSKQFVKTDPPVEKQGSSSSSHLILDRAPNAGKDINDYLLESIDLEVDGDFLIPTSITPPVSKPVLPQASHALEQSIDQFQKASELDQSSPKTDLALLKDELPIHPKHKENIPASELPCIPPVSEKEDAPVQEVSGAQNGQVFHHPGNQQIMSLSPLSRAPTPQSKVSDDPGNQQMTSLSPLPRAPTPQSTPLNPNSPGPLTAQANGTVPLDPSSSRQETEMTAEISIAEQAQVLGSDEEELNRAVDAEERELDENLALESNQWNDFLSGLEDQERLEEMRQETALEVKRLKEQRVKDRRDADDVNLQMSQDIQNLLKLFGIPYVVSPMEAEAQCAELLKLKLVDGIITDDSDVFLFGGHKVYKNLFNQNKFVECYLLNDLENELGLNQEKLIQLAFLLGSDYTTGLNGVGPVTAMEILSEFEIDTSSHPSSQDNQNSNLSVLLNFKNWWQKVQVGKETDLESSFQKKFRKKKDKIWLDDSWPNPIVADAYLHPIVDHSTENFVWGLPDLDGIREFLYDHLSWSSTKTDEVIVPLIKRQTQRSDGTIQTQGVLDDFFDYSIENNASRLAPPGINSAFSSRRLENIVKNWREKNKLNQQQESSSSMTTSSKKAKTTRQQQILPPKLKQKEPNQPVEQSNKALARPSEKKKQGKKKVDGIKKNNGTKNQNSTKTKKVGKTNNKRCKKNQDESASSFSSIGTTSEDSESNFSASIHEDDLVETTQVNNGNDKYKNKRKKI